MLHVAEELRRRYAVAAIDPQLLIAVNQLSAAKVPAFLKKQFAAA
jgi:DNA polymerase-3 subunit epsilon